MLDGVLYMEWNNIFIIFVCVVQHVTRASSIRDQWFRIMLVFKKMIKLENPQKVFTIELEEDVVINIVYDILLSGDIREQSEVKISIISLQT